MTERIVVLELARLEAAHLTDLIEQFATLLDSGVGDDPVMARLVPDAYRDDAEATAELRRLTEDDLLQRRRDDVRDVLATLQVDGASLRIADIEDDTATAAMTVPLDESQSAAWLRTLAALRLVLASRLEITDEGDHDETDPRFGVYDWIGYRLEGLLQALDD